MGSVGRLLARLMAELERETPRIGIPPRTSMPQQFAQHSDQFIFANNKSPISFLTASLGPPLVGPTENFSLRFYDVEGLLDVGFFV